MLFLISSAPDTKEFKTAYELAQKMDADICLLQNAVLASRNITSMRFHVLKDDMQLRGIGEEEISGKPINYSDLIDLITASDKVVGLF